ncbi:MAG: ADP-ribosylglycohydrolase family protein [Candidatus Babeliales bacterium]|nr:ADP-ribosylglycohydrolase family protein [Candidatus Babeliales bacterium]
MHLKKQLLLAFTVLAIQASNLKSNTIEEADRIKGCIMGGLIGDCLGKPTEFINSTEKIFKKYPTGIKNFQDLKDNSLCWKNEQTGQLFAPYTDDTAMARITLKILIESREKNWDVEKTMSELAIAYIIDMDNPEGWTMSERAPGNTCLKSLGILKHVERRTPGWWQTKDIFSLGCGSVMRAHPFGVVFADKPEKAAEWAAQHSLITHGHTAAQAACATMAIAVAYAIQGKDRDYIIEQMISIAKKYDPHSYARKGMYRCWEKIEDAIKHANNYPNHGREFYYYKHKMTLNIPSNLKHLEIEIKHSKSLFEKYEGWAADDAIAATAYIFALSSKYPKINVNNALILGVHTPGDSDSIASMSGALIGAYVGAKEFNHNFYNFEGSGTLENYANQVAQLINK